MIALADQAGEQPPAAPPRHIHRLLGDDGQVDVELARHVVGPLQVAAHPVEAVGDAGKHGIHG